MSCSGSHLGITINIKNTKFVKDLPMIDAPATAGLSLTLDPMGKNVSKCFFSETTRTIETKLPRNDHWKVLYKVPVLFVVSEKKAFEHFPIGSNVNLCPAVVAILDFRSA
jgi:trans-aconitate methyltransferase